MNILFEGIRIINPSQGMDIKANLWIKNGNIEHLDNSIPNLDSDTERINAETYVCSPGLFDMHVHFRSPGHEYKEDMKSGCASAANGGFTGVCIMPNTNPTIDNIQVLNFLKQESADCLTDVELSSSITQNREGELLSPMLELDQNGVKIFTDDGTAVLSSEVMKRAFDYARPKDLLLSEHCEDHSLTKDFSANEGIVSCKLGLTGYPSVAEEIIVSRDIMLSEFCGNCRFHVSHISTKGAVRIVKSAKERNARVTCEVTPHHFTLTEDLLSSYDTNLKMNPPLRTHEDVEAIIEGLKDGTIDCIASDHAPHAIHEKDIEYELAPNGIIGLETSFGVSMTHLYHKGILDLNQIIEKMSTNPRKILKIKDIDISIGEKANLFIFDPDRKWVVDKGRFLSKSENSPYIGEELIGLPLYTINNSKIHKCDL